MFRLHERTRKSLCRLGFVALCLLPTCAVALWAASRNTVAHRNQCAAELGRQLRLSVTLGSVEYPEPGAVRYTDFRLDDPQTEVTLARAPMVEVRGSRTVTAINAAKLTIDANAASAISELLHARLRDRTHDGDLPVRLSIGELIVASSKGDIPLFDLQARIEPTSDGRGAQLTFRAAASANDVEPVVLTIIRDRSGKIGFDFYTQDALQDPARDFGAVLHLLRALVAEPQVLVPGPGEAEALLRVGV